LSGHRIRGGSGTRVPGTNAQAIGDELAVRSGRRVDVLRHCNAEAALLRDYTWGEEQSARYRACWPSSASRSNALRARPVE